MQVSDGLNGYSQVQPRVFQVKSTREGARREGRQRGGVEYFVLAVCRWQKNTTCAGLGIRIQNLKKRYTKYACAISTMMVLGWAAVVAWTVSADALRGKSLSWFVR